MKIEDQIRQFKKIVHEHSGRPAPRGVARLNQHVLKYLQAQAKAEAEMNKKRKMLQKKLAAVLGAMKKLQKK